MVILFIIRNKDIIILGAINNGKITIIKWNSSLFFILIRKDKPTNIIKLNNFVIIYLECLIFKNCVVYFNILGVTIKIVEGFFWKEFWFF